MRECAASHFKVKMRSGCPPGVSHETDGLPGFDTIAFAYEVSQIVRVDGYEAALMLENHEIAVSTMAIREEYLASGRGEDLGSLFGLDVDTVVGFAIASSESRGNGTADWPRQWVGFV